MNPLQELEASVRRKLPSIEASLDVSTTAEGSSWLDLRLGSHRVAVEWRPGRGFGISSSPETAYGEGSDELYPDLPTTRERLVELLRTSARTDPNKPTLVRQLRQSQALSQEDLAAKMHVRQSAISRMERRADVLLSTLRQVVSAMGGTLEIRAKFPNREVRVDYLDLLSEEAGKVRSPRRTKQRRSG